MTEKIEDGGPVYPHSWEETTPNGWNIQFDSRGISLRDHFATCVDKDEYGDIIYNHLSRKSSEKLAGEPCPEEPTDAEKRADPDANAKYQIAKVAWEFKWRAVLRYMMADAMLAARKGGRS